LTTKKEKYFRHILFTFAFFTVFALLSAYFINREFGAYVMQGFVVFELIYSFYFFAINTDA